VRHAAGHVLVGHGYRPRRRFSIGGQPGKGVDNRREVRPAIPEEAVHPAVVQELQVALRGGLNSDGLLHEAGPSSSRSYDLQR
jgi:hypothetical protein